MKKTITNVELASVLSAAIASGSHAAVGQLGIHQPIVRWGSPIWSISAPLKTSRWASGGSREI